MRGARVCALAAPQKEARARASVRAEGARGGNHGWGGEVAGSGGGVAL